MRNPSDPNTDNKFNQLQKSEYLQNYANSTLTLLQKDYDSLIAMRQYLALAIFCYEQLKNQNPTIEALNQFIANDSFYTNNNISWDQSSTSPQNIYYQVIQLALARLSHLTTELSAEKNSIRLIYSDALPWVSLQRLANNIKDGKNLPIILNKINEDIHNLNGTIAEVITHAGKRKKALTTIESQIKCTTILLKKFEEIEILLCELMATIPNLSVEDEDFIKSRMIKTKTLAEKIISAVNEAETILLRNPHSKADFKKQIDKIKRDIYEKLTDIENSGIKKIHNLFLNLEPVIRHINDFLTGETINYKKKTTEALEGTEESNTIDQRNFEEIKNLCMLSNNQAYLSAMQLIRETAGNSSIQDNLTLRAASLYLALQLTISVVEHHEEEKKTDPKITECCNLCSTARNSLIHLVDSNSGQDFFIEILFTKNFTKKFESLYEKLEKLQENEEFSSNIDAINEICTTVIDMTDKSNQESSNHIEPLLNNIDKILKNLPEPSSNPSGTEKSAMLFWLIIIGQAVRRIEESPYFNEETREKIKTFKRQRSALVHEVNSTSSERIRENASSFYNLLISDFPIAALKNQYNEHQNFQAAKTILISTLQEFQEPFRSLNNILTYMSHAKCENRIGTEISSALQEEHSRIKETPDLRSHATNLHSNLPSSRPTPHQYAFSKKPEDAASYCKNRFQESPDKTVVNNLIVKSDETFKRLGDTLNKNITSMFSKIYTLLQKLISQSNFTKLSTSVYNNMNAPKREKCLRNVTSCARQLTFFFDDGLETSSNPGTMPDDLPPPQLLS